MRFSRAHLGEVILVFSGQAASAIGTLVSVRLLTRLLSPGEFGELALALTVVGFFQYAFAGTSGAAMRFFSPAAEQNSVGSFLSAAWRVHNRRLPLLASAFVVALAAAVSFGYGRQATTLLLPCLGLAAATCYIGMLDGFQNAARHRKIVALHQGSATWLRLGGAWAAITLFHASATAALWGFVMAAAVVWISQYLFYRRSVNAWMERPTSVPASVTTIRGRWENQMVAYAWPYVIWSLPVWLQLSSDRWALQWFGHASGVGVYAAYYQLAFLPVSAFTVLLTQVLQPILFARAGDLSDETRVAASERTVRWLVGITLIWTGVAAVLAFVLRSPVARLFLDTSYREQDYLLVPLVIAAGAFSAAQFAELRVIMRNGTQRLILPKAAVSVLACGMFLCAAKFFGEVGVSYVASIPFLVSLCFALCLTCPVPAPPRLGVECISAREDAC